MEKYIAAVLLTFTSASFAQEKVTTTFESYCITEKDLVTTIDKYTEDPLARGMSLRRTGTKEIKVPMVIFVNKKERTFSVAEKMGDDLYCVIAIGDNFVPLDTDGKAIK